MLNLNRNFFFHLDSIEFMIIFYLGRFTAANTFNILYLYVAEIVPTFFRSRAVSTRLCLNNFGAFIAPFVIRLLVLHQRFPEFWLYSYPRLSVLHFRKLVPKLINLDRKKKITIINLMFLIDCNQLSIRIKINQFFKLFIY